MFAIAGVTGRVGGAAARALLEAGRPVRAVVRDPSKIAALTERGAQAAVASFDDEASLVRAFTGADGVFVMIPPNFAPDPGYPDARRIAETFARAIERARPGRVVALSSVGGEQTSGLGLITQVHILEEALAALDVPTAILRPAWFMENAEWDIAPARDSGVMASFLTPSDRAFPMVATADIGRVAASVLTQTWQGHRVVEIEGPRRYSQQDIARLLGEAVGRDVRIEPVARDTWEAAFKAQGAAWPAPRIEMLDGFNRGWIDFHDDSGNEHVVGSVPYETVLAELVKRSH